MASSSWSVSPYGTGPGNYPSGVVVNRSHRIWKAYHARQALLQEEEQRKQPVSVDPLVWGDFLAGELQTLVEKERNHPRCVVPGSVADLKQGPCHVPEGNDAHLSQGARGSKDGPRAIRFDSRGTEFTADNFGAEGNFVEMYQRRYQRFTGRTKEADGLAAERARALGGGMPQTETRIPWPRIRRAQSNASRTIPWGQAQEVDGKGVTFFEGEAASALPEASESRRGEKYDVKAGKRPAALIGPGTHTLDHLQVAKAHDEQVEADSGGQQASVTAHLAQRSKLRGVAAEERKANARVPARNRFASEVAKRSHIASSTSEGCSGRGACSVVTFEDFYLRATQAADALPAVEQRMTAERVTTAGVARCVPKQRDRRKMRNMQNREALSWGEIDDASTPVARSNTLVLRNGCRSLAAGGGSPCDDFSATDSVSNLSYAESASTCLSSAPSPRGDGSNAPCRSDAAATNVPQLRGEGSRHGAGVDIVEPVRTLTTATVSDRDTAIFTTSERPPADSHPLVRADSHAYGCAKGRRKRWRRRGKRFRARGSASDNGDALSILAQDTWHADGTVAVDKAAPDDPFTGAGAAGAAGGDGSTGASVDGIGARMNTNVIVGSTSAVAAVGKGGQRAAAEATRMTPVVEARLGRAAHAGERKFTAELVDESPAASLAGSLGKSTMTSDTAPVPCVEGRAWQKLAARGHRRRRCRVAPKVHRINLGSKREQQSMTVETRTALFIGACEYGDLDALERLLQLGASPLDSYRPSVEGSRSVLSQFFIFLLQKVAAGSRSRLAPDDSAHDRALSLLVDAGLEADPKFLSSPALMDDDERGFCLLHHAAAFGNVAKVDFLLARGVDPDNRAGRECATALMVASARGQRNHLRVCAALLQAGAGLGQVDAQGMTALHHAANVGRKHMCHYLLLVGANKDVCDEEGRTPLDLCHGRHTRAYEALQSFAAREPPASAIIDYMEKVEVEGLGDLEALKQIEHKLADRTATVPTAAKAAAAVATLLGDENGSLTSWDAKSLGGLSGPGASVLSLGSCAASLSRNI